MAEKVFSPVLIFGHVVLNPRIIKVINRLKTVKT